MNISQVTPSLVAEPCVRVCTRTVKSHARELVSSTPSPGWRPNRTSGRRPARPGQPLGGNQCYLLPVFNRDAPWGRCGEGGHRRATALASAPCSVWGWVVHRALQPYRWPGGEVTAVVGHRERSGHRIHRQSWSVENDILSKVKRASAAFLNVGL